MIRANLERAVLTPPLGLLTSALRVASPDQVFRSPCEGGAADRLCAWAGRSGRRYIFSVFRLDASVAAPLVPKAIALMVRRPAMGPRRVLWAELMETADEVAVVMQGLTRHARPEADEIHLYALSADPEARRAVFADLAFPRLDTAEPLNGLLRLVG